VSVNSSVPGRTTGNTAAGDIIAANDAAPNVVAFARPPVRQATIVRSDIVHTFDVFVRTIGTWWPVRPFSAGAERVRDVTFEQREGGRIYETWHDGTIREWGTVESWTPPDGFVMSWQMTPASTEVEFRFTALGPALTRVAVEHRGWERLTESQLVEACALPGGYSGGAFAKGWAHILGCLATAVDGEATHEFR